MCGRFTSLVSPELLAERFGVPLPGQLERRYNIAPTQQVLVVRDKGAGRQLCAVRWGRLPSWPNDLDTGSEAINTRAETLSAPAVEKDSPLQPCLIPASGFFVWKRSGTRNQPWYITRRDGAPIGLAGVLGNWQTPAKTCIETCTIVTTRATGVVRPLSERMPLIVEPDCFGEWLSAPLPIPPRLQPLVNPLPSGWLCSCPVSAVVNRPAHDAADCIEPVLATEAEHSEGEEFSS